MLKNEKDFKMNFNVREANILDAEKIASIYVTSWRESFSGLVEQEYLDNMTINSRTEVWKGILKKEFCTTLVVEDQNSNVIGFISGGKFRSKKSCDSEIYAIYLLKDYQHLGIGKKLRNALCRLLIRRGFKSLCVWIFKENINNRSFFTKGSMKIDESEVKIGNQKLEEECFYWKDMNDFFKKETSETKLAFLNLEKLQSLFQH